MEAIRFGGRAFARTQTAQSAAGKQMMAPSMKERCILDGLPATERKLFLSKCIEHRFRRGDFLAVQGAPHTENYLLRRGIVRTFYISPAGREITLGYWSDNNLLAGPDFFNRWPPQLVGSGGNKRPAPEDQGVRFQSTHGALRANRRARACHVEFQALLVFTAVPDARHPVRLPAHRPVAPSARQPTSS